MKRVGERGGNQWERIGWEEAIDTIADALMDMKDKTGLEGLLCSTGGGNRSSSARRVSATSGARATCSSRVARSACRATTPCR